MQNITYFVGAGASYYSLPLIRTMNARMRAFSTFLKLQKDSGALKHKFTDEFIKCLDELIEIEGDRTSIDAYAKELYLEGSSSAIKLLRLKSILSSYLCFEQLIKPKELQFYSEESDHIGSSATRRQLDIELQNMIRTSLDKRYITFWGECLSKSTNLLPNNVKILSWNYDMQFEASYSEIRKYSIGLTQQNLQVFPSEQRTIDISRSCILKLNGTAGLFDDYVTKKYFNLFDFRKHGLMDNLDFLINPLERNFHREFNKPVFSFAWEDEPSSNKTRNYAKSVIEDTTILVIIGYSFPNFNRQVDKALFSNATNIQKIYYQAPKEDLDEFVDKLDGINPKLKPMTKMVTNLSTFYVPVEI